MSHQRKEDKSRRSSDRIKKMHPGTKQGSARIVKTVPKRPRQSRKRYQYFEADRVLNVRNVRGRDEYLVAWVNGTNGRPYKPSWVRKNDLTPALLKTFNADSRPNDKKNLAQQKNATPASLTASPTVTTRSVSRVINSYTVTPDAHPPAHFPEDAGRNPKKPPVGSDKLEGAIESLSNALKMLQESKQMHDNAVRKILECLQGFSQP